MERLASSKVALATRVLTILRVILTTLEISDGSGIRDNICGNTDVWSKSQKRPDDDPGGTVLTHRAQAAIVQGLEGIDSMASTNTFHKLSMERMRSTSRTLCLWSASIRHRRPFADSLKASYSTVSMNSSCFSGDGEPHEEVDTKTHTQRGDDDIENVFVIGCKVAFSAVDPED